MESFQWSIIADVSLNFKLLANLGVSLTAVILFIPGLTLMESLVSTDVSGLALVAGTANLAVAASNLEIFSKGQDTAL